MNKTTFVADAKERRKEPIRELMLRVLAKMLSDNVCYLDTHYIQDRTQEIITKTIAKLKFSSAEIQKARRAFLDVLLDGAKQQLYSIEDDYKQAKADLKDKDKKEQAKKVLDILDRMKAGNPKGLTEQRNMECEPVCQFIASEVLSKELILKDEEFINGAIEEDNENLVRVLYTLMFNDLFDQLIASLDYHYTQANEVNWGCRRDQIRLQNIHNRLVK